VPRGKIALGDVVERDLPEIKVSRGRTPAPVSPQSHFAQPPPAKPLSFGIGGLIALALIGVGSLVARRR
jgi:hypothetical protein